MNGPIELMGVAAGCMTTFCWLPQAVRILRTRDTKAISLTTQALFTLGCSTWAVYGMIEHRPSIVVFNVITAGLNAAITLMKYRLG